MDKKKKRRLGHGVVDEIFAVGWLQNARAKTH